MSFSRLWLAILARFRREIRDTILVSPETNRESFSSRSLRSYKFIRVLFKLNECIPRRILRGDFKECISMITDPPGEVYHDFRFKIKSEMCLVRLDSARNDSGVTDT